MRLFTLYYVAGFVGADFSECFPRVREMKQVLNMSGPCVFQDVWKNGAEMHCKDGLLNIAAILHWSLKPILHSLEQRTSRLRLRPSHQGDVIYIMRRCHGNKAPISTGVVSYGGWILRCPANMRVENTVVCVCMHRQTNIRCEPQRQSPCGDTHLIRK